MFRASFQALNRGGTLFGLLFLVLFASNRPRRRTEALDQWLRSGCLFHHREAGSGQGGV